MENSALHAQKLAILSRLIKETSLTLEEALILLKEETENNQVIQPQYPSWRPNPITPWTTPGPILFNEPFSGTNPTTTTAVAFNNTPSTLTADLK